MIIFNQNFEENELKRYSEFIKSNIFDIASNFVMFYQQNYTETEETKVN
jgi:hypothetical protein